MNYIELSTGKISTPTVMQLQGISLDQNTLQRLGYLPVLYPYPPYNADTHYLEPAGEPTLNATGDAYVQAFTVEELPLDTAKERLKSRVTALRFSHETGGVSLGNGVSILTGIDDQNRIASTIQGMELAGVASTSFKAASGWVTLTLAELKTISTAVVAHVQACFQRERTLHETIDAATSIAELGAIDVTAGWPGLEAA